MWSRGEGRAFVVAAMWVHGGDGVYAEGVLDHVTVLVLSVQLGVVIDGIGYGGAETMGRNRNGSYSYYINSLWFAAKFYCAGIMTLMRSLALVDFFNIHPRLLSTWLL